jgi:hypothetical protein
MDFIDKPKEDENHYTFLIFDSKPMRFNMMSLNLVLGAFSKAFSEPPSLDPFPPCLYFLELSIEFFATPSIKYLGFVLPSCLDGAHQGDSLAH